MAVTGIEPLPPKELEGRPDGFGAVPGVLGVAPVQGPPGATILTQGAGLRGAKRKPPAKKQDG